MKRIKPITRDLVLFVVISALVFIFALAYGSPFVARAASPSEVQAQSQQIQSSAFQGTILRNGERFSLRTSSGHIYLLDDPEHVQPYEGKNVRVTGTLDSNAKLIHVAWIEPA
jgi:hypothetical protein